MGDNSQSPPALPSPRLQQLDSGLVLLEPLSRKGSGPGLIILTPDSHSTDKLEIKNGVPSALLKWAEEGYTVIEITKTVLVKDPQILSQAITILSSNDKCQPKGPYGLIGKSVLNLTRNLFLWPPLAYEPGLWNQLLKTIGPEWSSIAGLVVYGNVTQSESIGPANVPSIHHLAGKAKAKLERSSTYIAYDYPSEETFLFASPHQPQFRYSSEAISHTRNLTFLKRVMNGPYFDLEAIWDEHTYYEFENRSVPHTMSTMVQEPYVNHIPTVR